MDDTTERAFPSRDDVERGEANAFDLDPGTSLYQSSIGSIRIHKAPDDSFGGWRVGRARILADGTEIYHNPSIDQWLVDHELARAMIRQTDPSTPTRNV